jgi:hypothetical protein
LVLNVWFGFFFFLIGFFFFFFLRFFAHCLEIP